MSIVIRPSNSTKSRRTRRRNKQKKSVSLQEILSLFAALPHFVQSNQSSNKKRKRKRKSRPQGSSKRQKSGHMYCASHEHTTPAGALYEQSCINTFSAVSCAGVPKAPATRTQIVPVETTFDATYNANGVIQVFLHPCISPSRGSITYTSATATCGSSTLVRTNAALTGYNGVQFNLPYTEAQLLAVNGLAGQTLIKSRIVAMTVEGNYSGNVLNRAGVAYAASTDSNDDVSNYTQAQIYALQHSVKHYINQDPTIECTVHGRSQNELELYSFNLQPEHTAYFPFGTSSTGTPPYYDYVAGAVSSSGPAVGVLFFVGGIAGQTVTFRAKMYIEYAGSAIAALCEPRYADEPGISTAHNMSQAISNAQHSDPTKSRVQHHQSIVGNMAAEGVGAAAKVMSHSSNPYIAGAGSAISGFEQIVGKKNMANVFDQMLSKKRK